MVGNHPLTFIRDQENEEQLIIAGMYKRGPSGALLSDAKGM